MTVSIFIRRIVLILFQTFFQASFILCPLELEDSSICWKNWWCLLPWFQIILQRIDLKFPLFWHSCWIYSRSFLIAVFMMTLNNFRDYLLAFSSSQLTKHLEDLVKSSSFSKDWKPLLSCVIHFILVYLMNFS